MAACEANFDGLPGPTHNYAGLAPGNLAAESHAHEVSNPMAAAREGLLKMKALHDMGLKQAVLPPHARPDVDVLRRLGFSGSDREILGEGWRKQVDVVLACYSAASMWTANAATVSPGADTGDGRIHFTPANLVTNFHRSREPETTSRVLQAIFADPDYFAHHGPLPAVAHFGDEGAANHTRLCTEYNARGIELFVYGREAFRSGRKEPVKYPARQTLEASASIARLHLLDPEKCLFAQQNPVAIDAGVFHNDVVCVGNGHVFLVHEEAFFRQKRVLGELTQRFAPGELEIIEVGSDEVSLKDAVASYLFNSQIVTLPGGGMAMIAPGEAEENEAVKNCIERMIADSPSLQQVHYFDLRQSMKNGGGPACLRLRVVLSDDELAAVNQKIWLDDVLFDELNAWIDDHYRDRLSSDDFADPSLLRESREALDRLTQILDLGAIYDFQRP